ncbi:MAG: PIN domain-containing protein [Candidatus Bathyarchaeia archaeon]
MPVKVILDTNFLMLSPVFHGDVFEELDKSIGRRTEKIVLTPIYQELERISKKSDKKVRKQAETVLKHIENDDFKSVDIELKSSETVDDLIVRIATLWKCFVATNDRALRKRLIISEIPVVYLRQRNRLEVKG